MIFPDLEILKKLNDDLKEQAFIKNHVKINNKWLQKAFDKAGIDKVAGFHKARHAFGEAAGDAIPVQMLQMLYGHSHLSTTAAYQGSFIHKSADDALKSVLRKKKPANDDELSIF